MTVKSRGEEHVQPHSPRVFRPLNEIGELSSVASRFSGLLLLLQDAFEDLKTFEIPGGNRGCLVAIVVPCAVDRSILENPPWGGAK